VDDVIVDNAGGYGVAQPRRVLSDAVLVTRLLADMLGDLDPVAATARYGLATHGAAGGLGVATLVERVTE
jgi:hypothetical protein